MTATEELRWLARLFPNSKELAVSREMVERFEAEMVASQRFAVGESYTPFKFVEERFPTIVATRLPLCFRDRRLTLVELWAS